MLSVLISDIQPLLMSIPVRIFLKASSTFVESKADVSMNDRLFFSAESERKLKMCQQ